MIRTILTTYVVAVVLTFILPVIGHVRRQQR